MGQRLVKNANSLKNKLKSNKSEDLKKNASRDKIREIDFFGFPPEMFIADLKRTAWSTLAITVILGLVYIVTAKG